MSKQKIRGLIGLALVFVVYQVIAFAPPFAKTGTFWLSYVFTLVAIFSQLYIFYAAGKDGETVKSRFYGLPLAQIGLIYLAVQFILGLIFMILAAWVPAWISLILYVLLFAATAVGLIASEAMREEIMRQDVVLKKDVSVMRALQSLGAAMVSQTKQEDLKKSLQELSDALRYSDPVSSEAVAEIEQELKTVMEELQQTLIEENSESAKTLCKRCSVLLAERNRLCKLNK